MTSVRQTDTTGDTQASRIVVALMGLPGSGKTTIAGALVERLGVRRVCRDAIRHAMFPECDYSFIEKRAAFRGVLLAVEINCLLGAPSVVDGMTFARREDFDRLAELAGRHGFELVALFADCTPAIARMRVANDAVRKGHLARDRGPALVDEVAGRFETLPDAAIRIDTSAPAAEMCAAAVAAVAARGSVLAAQRPQDPDQPGVE